MSKAKVKQIFSSNLIVLLCVIIVLSVILTILSDYFFQVDNLKNIMQQCTIYGLLGIGMTFVILTGGIDLSVGSALAFSGVVLGMCLKGGAPLPAAILVCVVIGIACGMLNGSLVTLAKVPPFIATMGTLMIFRGMALVVTMGQAITGFDKDLIFIGSGELGGIIPVSFLLFIIALVIAYFVLEHTKFGRYLYVLGGNSEAARLSGIRVNLDKFLAYAICGACAAVASIVMAGRLNSAQPIAADGYELDAIATATLGGVSMSGGSGSIWGTFLGAITLTIVRNGMNLLNVHTYWQKIIIGAIIIIAVMFDTLRSKDKK